MAGAPVGYCTCELTDGGKNGSRTDIAGSSSLELKSQNLFSPRTEEVRIFVSNSLLRRLCSQIVSLIKVFIVSVKSITVRDMLWQLAGRRISAW